MWSGCFTPQNSNYRNLHGGAAPLAGRSSGPSTNYLTSCWGCDMDASRSSSIYGNSETVQPNALKLKYIIKT